MFFVLTNEIKGTAMREKEIPWKISLLGEKDMHHKKSSS